MSSKRTKIGGRSRELEIENVGRGEEWRVGDDIYSTRCSIESKDEFMETVYISKYLRKREAEAETGRSVLLCLGILYLPTSQAWDGYLAYLLWVHPELG